MPEDLIDYPRLLQESLLHVVRQVLERSADQGLPGNHHFYIAFSTQDPGVEISQSLLNRFPEEMVIVLQNDFRDLEVEEEGFGVTLRFGGIFQRLFLPWTSLRSFTDPSVQLQFSFAADLQTRSTPVKSSLKAVPNPSVALKPPATKAAATKAAATKTQATKTPTKPMPTKKVLKVASQAETLPAAETPVSETVSNVVAFESFRKKS
jgi:uncharacterized protein